MNLKKLRGMEYIERVVDDAGPAKQVVVLEPRKWMDACIVGVFEDVEGHLRLVYSEESIVQGFQKYDGMEEEEALEYFSYNTVRALPYMHDAKNVGPVILYDR